jgi:lysine biosynthesis protein LysW
MMPKAECPYCEEEVVVTRVPKLGQRVTCPSCGERLEVVNLDPFVLDFEGLDDDVVYDDWDDAALKEDHYG